MKKLLLHLTLTVLLGLSINAQYELHDSLVLYLPFTENAEDYSGNENHGSTKGVELAEDRFEIPNSAYKFDSTDYIEISSNSSLNPENQLTIALWLKVDTLTNRFTPVIHKGGVFQSGFTNREYLIYLEDDGRIFLEAAGDVDRTYMGASIPTDGTWFFYVGIIDRLNHYQKVYVNDSLKNERIDNNNSFLNNDSAIKIGSWDEEHSQYAPSLTGCIDDVRIYNRILDSNEISEIYNEGVCHKYVDKTITFYDTILVYDTVRVYDTVAINDTITVYDSIKVTDTLLINVDFTNIEPAAFTTIKVFPNPTQDVLYINTEDYSTVNNYMIKIVGLNSNVIYESLINQSLMQVDLSDFGSEGLYIIQVIDEVGNIKNTKKILLE